MTIKKSMIPNRLKNASKEHPYVAGAEDIYDDALGKPQSTVNNEVGTAIAEHTQKIEDLQAMEQIVIDGGEAQIAQGSDFDNPDATKRAKVTTVGAIIDGINEGVFDLTAKTGDSYATLDDALTAANSAIPTNKKKGGMSIRFVQTSDNKYVQFRYISSSTADADFTNVANWQGVDNEPVAESINLVESGGVDKCNFVYDSIIEKQNDIINMFDKTKKSSYQYVKRTDGTTQLNDQFFTTDYIPIDSDGLYAYQGCTGGTWLGYACYNANKAFTHGASSRQATFQEGDVYARFSGYNEDFDTFMVIKGTSADQPSSYVPYGYKAGKLKDDTVDTGNIKNNAITNDKLALNAVQNSNIADDSVSVTKIQSKSVTEPKVSFLETVPAGNNLLNPNDPNYIRQQKYGINKNTGAAGYANLPLAFGYTGFIPVSTEGLYCNCNVNTGTFSGAVYNKNKEFIRQLATADYTYVEGDAYVRWTLAENPASPYTEGQFMINEGTTGKGYEAYTEKYIMPAGMIPPIDIDVNDLMGILIQEKIFTSAIDMFLPDKLYAVRGDKLQLFFQGMAKVVNPEMYNYLVACSVGNQYHRYFEYNVPANAELGNKEFVIKIKDNNRNVLGTAQSILKVVDTPSSPSSNINVLCVGDSITSNGVWPSEMQRRLKGTGGTPTGNGLTNITFVGSMLKEGVNFEGHSGWAWSDYTTEGRPAFRFYVESGANVSMGNVYTNNGFSYTVIEISDDNSIRCSTSSTSNVPQVSGTLTLTEGSGDPTVAFTQSAQDSQNPFWDSVNNKMSFVSYANTYCNGVIDVVYVLLGGNKLFTNQTDDVKTFIDTLHIEFPNAKVKLMGGYVPSMKLMMPGYGASGTLYADTYNVLCTIKEQCRLYQEIANLSEYSSFVEYLDVACQFDSDYNMAIMQKAVNTRNSETEPYAYNTIHASPTSGYLQIADAAYRNFVGNFCQD